MSDLVRLIIEVCQLVWPFRLVHQWEHGAYYVCGRFWRVVKAGVYPVVPWFMDVKTVSTAEAIFGTGRQDITLSDGRTLSFAATAKAHVVDANLALNSIDDIQTSSQEILSSVLADKLAEVDAERLSHDRRGRLFASLRAAVAAEAALHGVEITNVRFTSFVLNPKTIRLLIDQTSVANW